MKIKLQQHPELPDKARVDKTANWIIVVPGNITLPSIKNLPYGEFIDLRRKQLNKKFSNKTVFSCDLPNRNITHLAFACIDPEISSFELLGIAADLIKQHRDFHGQELGVILYGYNMDAAERMAEAVISAMLAAVAEMPEFKSGKDRKGPVLNKINIFGVKTAHGFKRSFAEAEGNALARSLSMLPPNSLTPTDYLKEVKKLAKVNDWQLQFYNLELLKKKKAGAFIAVAQGSPVADAGIVRLIYRPQNRSSAKRKLSLVGKGICYDTGGTNLKPANYMFGMHEDMQGSAVALGTLLALSRLKVNYPVECWLALAMNHIGPKAYKQNDVVTACDGTTIEVVHTDAEGRMVLCDTLVLASKEKPSLIIDYATLTGACIYSLGTAYSGIFTNREALNPVLIEAGKDSGERVWPFPMDEDYDKLLESNIADIKQCSRESGMDHILASRFLQRFVKNNVPWIHVDLSSSNRKGGLAHVPTDTTGFGIRLTLNLLMDKKVMDWPEM